MMKSFARVFSRLQELTKGGDEMEPRSPLSKIRQTRGRRGISPEFLQQMHEMLGPASYGDRAQVAQKMFDMGGPRHPDVKQAMATGEPGSIGHAMRSLHSEVQSVQRRVGMQRKEATVHTDSIEGPISKPDLQHNALQWAAYHHHVEYRATGAALPENESLRVLGKNLIQQRETHIIHRNRAVAEQGLHPYHTMHDIRTLAQVVDKQPELFSDHERNHFHVMHAALEENARGHAGVLKESNIPEGQHPFQPSWSAIEPVALHVMHRAAHQLQNVGDNGDYLRRVTAAALAAQVTHPAGHLYSKGSSAAAEPRRAGYPALHAKGSEGDLASHEFMKRMIYTPPGQRQPKKTSAAVPAVPAAPQRTLTISDGEGHTSIRTPADLLAEAKAKRGLLKSMAERVAEPEEDPLVAPAIRLKNGTVVAGGPNHIGAAKRAIAEGHNHKDIAHAILFDENGTGFVTRGGKYIPRPVAYRYALRHSQLTDDAKTQNIPENALHAADVAFHRALVFVKAA